ncbi:MAG TPA: DedA family protein, partial [Beijerinckiaceae bacterium]
MPEYVQSIMAFLKANQGWAPAIVFALAFAESLALLALLVPATVILWGVGALIGAADLDFLP